PHGAHARPAALARPVVVGRVGRRHRPRAGGGGRKRTGEPAVHRGAVRAVHPVARRVRAEAGLRRVLVLGARGFFGRHAVALLRADGITAIPISHAEADVADRPALRALIRPGDVILDTVGPFQTRSPALLDVVLERQADLVDLSDSAAYARSIGKRRDEIAARGSAVL